VITTLKNPYLPGQLTLRNPEATKTAGFSLGRALRAIGGAVFLITLEGPLGVGKTTLCQGLAEALGAQPGEVVSPTFTLCNEYSAEIPLYHMDLYRLGENAAEEFAGAGLEERLEGLCLVEWPERLDSGFWPDDRLALFFQYAGDSRILSARGHNPLAVRIWETAVDCLQG
jgi:tRNA threonylcarbamoyladenosine biosynthesis protein TsaE